MVADRYGRAAQNEPMERVNGLSDSFIGFFYFDWIFIYINIFHVVLMTCIGLVILRIVALSLLSVLP